MLLLAMAMMSFSQLSAQESAVDDHGIFNHLSVGVGVGLTGISIEAAAPITPYVTVRGGVNIFPQIKVKTDLDLDGEIPASYNGPRSFDPKEYQGRRADGYQQTQRLSPRRPEDWS